MCVSVVCCECFLTFFFRHFPVNFSCQFSLRPNGLSHVNFLSTFLLSLDSCDDNQKVRNVGDFVHQIRCDSFQAVVGELARRENVYDVGRVLVAGIGNVDDSGGLLLLQVVDEVDFQMFGLSKDVAVIESAGES